MMGYDGSVAVAIYTTQFAILKLRLFLKEASNVKANNETCIGTAPAQNNDNCF